jgi:hypothetical protein
MTADCGEDWTPPTTPAERLRAGLRPNWSDTPGPYELREAELADLHNQGAGPAALRRAHNVPTGRYL